MAHAILGARSAYREKATERVKSLGVYRKSILLVPEKNGEHNERNGNQERGQLAHGISPISVRKKYTTTFAVCQVRS